MSLIRVVPVVPTIGRWADDLPAPAGGSAGRLGVRGTDAGSRDPAKPFRFSLQQEFAMRRLLSVCLCFSAVLLIMGAVAIAEDESQPKLDMVPDAEAGADSAPDLPGPCDAVMPAPCTRVVVVARRCCRPLRRHCRPLRRRCRPVRRCLLKWRCWCWCGQGTPPGDQDPGLDETYGDVVPGDVQRVYEQ